MYDNGVGAAPRAWVGGVALRRQNDSSFKFACFFDGVCIETLVCRPVGLCAFLTPSLPVPCFGIWTEDNGNGRRHAADVTG